MFCKSELDLARVERQQYLSAISRYSEQNKKEGKQKLVVEKTHFDAKGLAEAIQEIRKNKEEVFIKMQEKIKKDNLNILSTKQKELKNEWKFEEILSLNDLNKICEVEHTEAEEIKANSIACDSQKTREKEEWVLDIQNNCINILPEIEQDDLEIDLTYTISPNNIDMKECCSDTVCEPMLNSAWNNESEQKVSTENEIQNDIADHVLAHERNQIMSDQLIEEQESQNIKREGELYVDSIQLESDEEPPLTDAQSECNIIFSKEEKETDSDIIFEPCTNVPSSCQSIDLNEGADEHNDSDDSGSIVLNVTKHKHVEFDQALPSFITESTSYIPPIESDIELITIEQESCDEIQIVTENIKRSKNPNKNNSKEIKNEPNTPIDVDSEENFQPASRIFSNYKDQEDKPNSVKNKRESKEHYHNSSEFHEEVKSQPKFNFVQTAGEGKRKLPSITYPLQQEEFNLENCFNCEYDFEDLLLGNDASIATQEFDHIHERIDSLMRDVRKLKNKARTKNKKN